LAFTITGNRGAQKEISVSTNFLKDIVPFQQEFPMWGCDVKNDPIGHLESASYKNPTPTPSVVRNPSLTPTKNLRSFRLRL